MATACASYSTYIVAEDGAVYAWGMGDHGQLGLGDQEHRRQPERVSGSERELHLHGNSPVVLVAASGFHFAAATEDGGLWTCGAGRGGRLGLGDGAMRSRPVRIGPELFGGSPVVLVACGAYHTLAVTGAGRVYTSGNNGDGQLGHGNTTSTLAFALVEHFGSAASSLLPADKLTAWRRRRRATSSPGELEATAAWATTTSRAIWRRRSSAGSSLTGAKLYWWPPGSNTRWRWKRAGCCGCGVMETMASWA